jgi:murein DD-endopeptidase MepM/ murein hydrolase activator NlpD
MKFVIMPSRQGQYPPISVSVSRLILIVGLLFVGAFVAGAALQRLVWTVQPETLPVRPLAAVSSSLEPSSSVPDAQAMRLLATKVGELQATVARLDGLGQRVAKVAGLPSQDVTIVPELPEATFVLDDLWVPASASNTPPLAQLEGELGWLQKSLLKQGDYLSMLDLAVTQRAATVARLPTAMPIESYPYLSSSYGWRRNPFNGQMSMHEGLDFSAPHGTPIRAAAGGVVRTVTVHRGYGNMVEVDHGEGLMTRYAHAKTILVKEGEVVTRGQMIARVGSTGLSTGPHLHFEVRKDDKPLDPRAFLAGQPMAESVASARSITGSSSMTWRPRVR